MFYAFETPEFGLDENGLHRLRSRFAFETIPYPHLQQAVVKRGKSVQNWVLLLIVGICCLTIAVFIAYRILDFLFGDAPTNLRIEIHEVAIPVFPAFIGVSAIWQALKETDILEVKTGRRRIVLPLDKLRPVGQLRELQQYLLARTGAATSSRG
ncbi:hypothetical protein Q5H93_05555 [Hymenobacter sp. ASUV-10]|uniref:DUF304 domain-containing protein n=1 Tax=Hymenobacter aranciens TaxID=3063996 RepID=A0ABT9B7E0_9BACT|nr:hypothetical protein [Hymenobacter sp. ASUV-10]MDO7874191.1 hypothetical protein [Hymenobacter sp. ASUV-10]